MKRAVTVEMGSRWEVGERLLKRVKGKSQETSFDVIAIFVVTNAGGSNNEGAK